jgi:glycosyltransferase involved in cell wall biosynthesis
MQQLVTHVLGRTVEVMALFPDCSGYQRRRPEGDCNRTITYDFLYVATGEPHKNHLTLLEAWKLLASEGLYPSLCLTVSESDYPVLARIVEQTKADLKLNIYNVPAASPSEMRQLYRQARAMVYPSVMESFGLPLVEARQAGLSIIAAELDYVRDLIDPEESFDPHSPQSIARAIKRFLQIPETPLPVLTSDAFISRLLAV